MRRKVRALAAEGRFSAMLLSAVPIALFLVLRVIAPDFYSSVWHIDFTKLALAVAGAWMMVGNYIMFRMVSFKIDAMDTILTLIPGNDPTLMMSVLVFAAAAMIAFTVMASVRVRTDVKRRAAGIVVDASEEDAGSRSLRHASIKATQQLIDYTNRYFSPTAEGETRKLRAS